MIKEICLTVIFSSFILLLYATPDIGALQAQHLLLKATGSETTPLKSVESDPYRSSFFRVSGTPRITVNTVSGGVEVYENEALDGVQVDLFVNRSFSLWSGARNLDNYRILLQQRGDQIIASVEDKRSGRGYKGDSGIEFNFVIQTPEKASVEIQSMTGHISVQGISGRHFIQNHSGDIDLWKIDGKTRVSSTEGDIGVTENSGTLFMKTVTGDIFIEKSSGEIRLKSVEGNIEVHEIEGTLVTSTVNGNIFSQFTEVTKGIFMQSVTGNIDLIVPGRSGYQITAEAMEFDFDELDLTQSEMDMNFRNASLTIRDGEIPIKLESVSGKITVKESR